MNFDTLFRQIALKIPAIGKPLEEYYVKHNWFKRFVKFGTMDLLIYWLLKAPLLIILTDWLGIWYALAAFIVGLIITVLGFSFSELWIWKKRKND